MRILHVSDFHFRQRWFHWLTAEAAHHDIVCFTGDFIDIFPGGTTTVRQQARWVRDWLREWPGRLYACSGNHDCWPQSEHATDTDADGGWLKKMARPGVAVDGTAECSDGFRFVCCPWGRTPRVEANMPVILLSHAPPLGTGVSLDLGREVGDPELAEVAAKLPVGSMVLSGHIHNPRRWCALVGTTWCFNPGVNFESSTPNHIVIDTGAGEATFRGWGRELGPLRLGSLAERSLKR